ncbi:YpoC family protein [Ectobacillus ponti]|uniref:GTPase n=1 Tax=Ectobacillus ponti TaxID=2961894 RepID=A0AA41X4I0_9BACI|nr:GTPase [Ectobacillus ponti]MCP8968789.1 GTPase [Ectobacillus ponti]
MSKFAVPSAYLVIPFFSPGAVLQDDGEKIFGEQYLLYDILADLPDLPKPWQQMESSIPLLLKRWKDEHTSIAQLFRERQKEAAKEPMVRYTAYLLSLLHWLNGVPVKSLVHLYDGLGQLQRKPVNVEERLRFIIAQPAHHHSYIQLAELYEEAEKLFYKALAMQKKS